MAAAELVTGDGPTGEFTLLPLELELNWDRNVEDYKF